MIFTWLKNLFKRGQPEHDHWHHTHWPDDDDKFNIPRMEGRLLPNHDYRETNKLIKDAVADIVAHQKTECPELWGGGAGGSSSSKTRRKKVPHPHKGKRKGRRKVGSHIRKARHKRKHARR
jgi:hypothetical protein